MATSDGQFKLWYRIPRLRPRSPSGSPGEEQTTLYDGYGSHEGFTEQTDGTEQSNIGEVMNELIRAATAELAQFLALKLPSLSGDWWREHVVDRLSFQQQRMVQERGFRTLQQLDFAALLRVLDQNWYDLCGAHRLPREGRTWVRELQTVRNKWAHLSAEAMPDSEIYRDADTLGRLMTAIGATPGLLSRLNVVKATALAAMVGKQQDPRPEEELVLSNTGDVGVGAQVTAVPSAASMFKVGDVVALRSSPKTLLPIIEVIPGGAEIRYQVFQNNARATYYERQFAGHPTSRGGPHGPLGARAPRPPDRSTNSFSFDGESVFAPLRTRSVCPLSISTGA
jgi:hypothetical protein